MKAKKTKSLAEVIQQEYKVEPLSRGFALRVADRVMKEEKTSFIIFGKWTYIFSGLLCLVAVVICLSFLPQADYSPALLLLLLPVAFYFLLSFKIKTLKR